MSSSGTCQIGVKFDRCHIDTYVSNSLYRLPTFLSLHCETCDLTATSRFFNIIFLERMIKFYLCHLFWCISQIVVRDTNSGNIHHEFNHLQRFNIKYDISYDMGIFEKGTTCGEPSDNTRNIEVCSWKNGLNSGCSYRILADIHWQVSDATGIRCDTCHIRQVSYLTGIIIDRCQIWWLTPDFEVSALCTNCGLILFCNSICWKIISNNFERSEAPRNVQKFQRKFVEIYLN